MAIQRTRSPAPPPPPPKDTLTSTSSQPSTRPESRYLNSDLAEALKASVHIGTGPKPSTALAPPLTGQPINNNTDNIAVTQPSPNPSVPRRTPSPLPPGAAEGFMPTHGYSRSSPDMSSITQPQLPSQRMAVQNPFEQDEMEPSGTGRVRAPGGVRSAALPANVETQGVLPAGRVRINRATTGTTTSTSTSSNANLLPPASPTKTRVRRSMSSDSYALDPPRELTAAEKKAADDKKGSRHADVIDTWDPTGLGSAMWHHAGPYDAAAPSRNVNLPQSKAPMSAFNGAPVQSPPRMGPSTISLASPPAPPAKDPPADSHIPRRVQAAMRQPAPNSRRVSGGGLTGQYSTSMPASGGYFPDADAEVDEAALMRKERQKERDSKRRALKAAWGIDNPEPFEDFGASPGEGGSIDRGVHDTSPQSSSLLDAVTEGFSSEANTAPLPTTRPLRSPGLRLGLGPRTPPIKDEGPVSPISEHVPPIPRAGSGPALGGGVKRNKSLMQKFRTMVRQRSGSVESAQLAKVRPGFGAGQRSQSMTGTLARPAISPGRAEGEYFVEEEQLMEEPDDRYADATEDVFGRPSHAREWNGTAERRFKSEDRGYAARR